MHRFRRPRKPDGFDAAAKPHLEAARAGVTNSGFKFQEGFWKGYKNVLSEAQHRKCGFCEVQAVGPAYGDVEHFSPKGAVWSIKTPGEERRNLANVKGRTPNKLAEAGYWWLAYDWDNWLLACGVCNRAWKQSFFPVRDAPRSLPPTEDSSERPLLLHPFRGPRPGKHLKFGALGEVEPRRRSAHGRATIDVCGLDRPSLREHRAEIAGRIHRLLRRIEDTDVPTRVEDALRDLHRAGDQRVVHCGMVRAIFEEETGTTWRELEQRVAQLPDD